MTIRGRSDNLCGRSDIRLLEQRHHRSKRTDNALQTLGLTGARRRRTEISRGHALQGRGLLIERHPFNRAAIGAELLQRRVRREDVVIRLLRKRELLLQAFRRRLYAWIHAHDKRLRETLAVDRQLHGVRSGHHPRRCWRRRGGVRDRGDRITHAAGRRRVMQVPHEAMHSRRGRQRMHRTDPIPRNLPLVFRRLCFVAARVAANELAAAVEDFESGRTG